jgi:hypothetical protein
MDVISAALRLIAVAAALVAAAACGGASAPPRTPPAPLSHTFESPEALAQAVLAALADRNLDRLRTLPLSEQEFRDRVWPELPASRPERNVPFEYAWGQMKQRSDGHLQTTFGRYAGRTLRLVRTGFSGETTPYATFTVRRRSEIVATDDSGRDLVLKLYGSVLVEDGRYKLFSYVVDE